MVSKLLFLILISLIIACSPSKKSTSPVEINISQLDSIAGREAIGKNDCFTCHRFEEKLVGPSFISIANKYDQTNNNIARLIKKIEKGGEGTWGRVPMIPHPNLSQEVAQKMVQYILSLKNK